ncbi:MAG: cobalamin-dependent protein [Deltaproteobacteria bacterium]|nr:cobalamin-dependent protein [Deltaproteobacteria bacterium]MBW2640674.1 cobalamin-dependent protein [Deltaproteobacteria bacterium]MBW2681255.1 cobalamin-dependent protein [Deltaproteobacteria bacterium]
MNTEPSVHPLGTRAKVLLSSVFGPYAQNDKYGSREINPMELYHNQVTRVQGTFSLRMFHRNFGLMLIQSNIESPCTLLDFPSLDRFIHEIEHHSYDIVGISSIIPNIGKLKKMCELVRKYLPKATIVVGGHVANKGGIHEIIDADHIVKGEGVQWFRTFVGQKTTDAIRHPLVYSGFGTRILGITLREKPGDTAAVLLPSVGCPVGCNFCSTSALFGGKGKFINFYPTGDELFSIMCQLEEKLNVRSFFTMDENFLLHRERALRLLELMQKSNKSWALYVFSSARALKSYTIEQLVGLGISWVWMGLEGEQSQYSKLNNVETLPLVRSLQSHGIRVLGSSIIGLENHAPDNIHRIIDYAVSHDTDFHQFMLYTPIPGTPLYEEHQKRGTLLAESEFPLADTHGQYRFNYRHQHIPNAREEQFILDAFQRDFEVNGPSLARLIRTLLKGWKKYEHYPDKRIRDRFAWEVKPLRTTYAAAVWAMRKRFRTNKRMAAKMNSLLQEIYETFGWKTRIIAPLAGRYVYAVLKKEERRLANGWTYEPDCFYEKNAAALALENALPPCSEPLSPKIRCVSCKASPVPVR